MNLYAFKSSDGYLRLTQDGSFTLVGIGKASVYGDAQLSDLKKKLAALKEDAASPGNLRLVRLVLKEEDYFVR